MTNELTDVRCPCGDEFPADSYDAGFIAGSGMCQNCDAAMPPKDIPAPVEQAGGDERVKCAVCVDSGKVYDISGEGPWKCYACTGSHEVIGYANGDELDNMLDDRTAVLSPVKTSFHTVPVYREARAALAQPSPVLPPFAEKVLAKLRRFYDCASDFESGGVDIGRHWLDLLTQLGLLNRVQRSPALWEITQQGEDLLGTPQPSPAQADEKPGDSILCYGCFAKGVGPEHFDEAGKCLVRQQLDPLNLAQHAEEFNEAPAEALKPEQAKAERPEVVGYLATAEHPKHGQPHKALNYFKDQHDAQVAHWRERGCEVSEDELMAVAQHERIAASRWERAMDLMGEHVARISDKLTAERDAALAEVERLRQFERICEGLPQDAIDGGWTVQGIRRYAKRLEDQLKVALVRVAKLEHSQSFQRDIDYSVLSEYADKHRLHFNNLCAVVRSALIALPAQAQHSVPDGYRLIRLEHFAAIKAQLDPKQVDAYRGRNIYDEDKVYANWNECRSALDEIKDVFQQIDWDAENELAELLAAAPGTEVPQAWLDVQAERRRQAEVEGYHGFRDSHYISYELSKAARAYIEVSWHALSGGLPCKQPESWPWMAGFKWSDGRTMLVKACALTLAEIERLDRAAAPGKEVGHE
ncbi:hypothetical protein O0445_06630 [Pseudomonas aeruginosa]|uniref:hypothetical protein n=1 Tax=Pseudomonas aeruginosa TaxID=287 RepID=UPI002358129D|nr:hypothetical protein KKY83_06615 [Pseudomonas aeruginosa]